MKKFFIILIMLIVMTGCNTKNDLTQKIVAPSNNTNPINWTWIITKEIHSTDENTEHSKLGQEIEFSREYLFYNDSIINNPTYQIKKMNTLEFTSIIGNNSIKDYIEEMEDVEIVTVIDNNRFFCEVVILSDDKIILKISNKIYLLEKSDKQTLDINSENKQIYQNNTLSSFDDEISGNIGLLIGLRSQNENGYSYRTIWISKQNDIYNSIDIPKIFFPRRRGFWSIDISENFSNSHKTITSVNMTNRIKEYDTFFENNEKTTDKEMFFESDEKIIEKKMLFESNESIKENDMFYGSNEKVEGKTDIVIDYVGNDYISIIREFSFDNEDTHREMSIIPVDTLPDLKDVSITHFLGEQGEVALKNSRDRFINNLKKSDSEIIVNDNVKYNNIGLARSMGQWIFVSYINYTKGSGSYWEKYKIAAIPPNDLVFYDTMHLSWSQVKDKVPYALDIFTAPFKDIAVIITEKEILVYKILNDLLDDYPVSTIKLHPGEVVILSEWATGSYVEKWEQTVLNQVTN